MKEKLKKLKLKVVNGFKHHIKPMCMFFILSKSFLIFSHVFSYKKWLNKSKVLDKELPDSRRNKSDDRIQDDEISSAQTKPSKIT